jgi:hypothetical protein
MHFSTKNYLKSNRYHTANHPLSLSDSSSSLYLPSLQIKLANKKVNNIGGPDRLMK